MLQQYQPDIAVCTHFLPAEIISWLKAKRRLGWPLHTAVVVLKLVAFVAGLAPGGYSFT